MGRRPGLVDGVTLGRTLYNRAGFVAGSRYIYNFEGNLLLFLSFNNAPPLEFFIPHLLPFTFGRLEMTTWFLWFLLLQVVPFP